MPQSGSLGSFLHSVQNVKSDTLSRQFSSSSEDQPLRSIIHRSLILVPVSWGIEIVVGEVQVGMHFLMAVLLTYFLFLLRPGPRYFSGLTHCFSPLIREGNKL